ncbi:MAG: hypothetical protein M5U14_09385 [Acidimicrobiia bacterium]|nr:hypothetical protein [Acidimicrobiia bacterium]
MARRDRRRDRPGRDPRHARPGDAPALNGETTYQRDYRIGAALKALTDDHPGTTVIVNHHDRKASSDDFVDAVSGTHGLAGSADTVVILGRGRHDSTGLVQVTGRDVPEAEYAVTFVEGVLAARRAGPGVRGPAGRGRPRGRRARGPVA